MIPGQRAAVAAVLLTAAAVTYCAHRLAIGENTIALPAVFYASQPGELTLDRGKDGGNPFASALIELLNRPTLTYGELQSDLIDLTKKKSRGFQTPEVSTATAATPWRLKPVPASAKRVALVFVYSDYRDTGRASLPGAEHDLKRVTAALRNAGFEVQAAANPAREDLRAALEVLSIRSADAEAAAIYVTGHGFQHGDRVYLMPSDYPFDEGPERLPEFGVDVASLTDYLRAKSANVVFFGGCRTYW